MAKGLLLSGNRDRLIAAGLAACLLGLALSGRVLAEDQTAGPAPQQSSDASAAVVPPQTPDPAQPEQAAPASKGGPEADTGALAVVPDTGGDEAKPLAGTAIAPTLEARPAEPNPATEAAAKPDAKPAEPTKPEPAEDDKAVTQKPQDAKPQPLKPAEPKEAKGDGKPKDLVARSPTGEELAVRASNINAVYEIHFLGAHIGDFRIRSSITNRQYTLQANADVSVFFGAFSWQGSTSSHGLMTANGPMPQTYNFRYASGERREAIELRFQQRMVQDIIINPPAHPGMRTVPITAAHLQNVLDPLSAVILLAQARLNRHTEDPCSKRLPIFDGKTRYDLLLSSKGTRPVAGHGRLHGPAYVCAVHFVPIAGHKQGKQGENDYAAGNTGIEVWLVPVPEAGLLVPYYVHVPTPAGTASMVTARFDIDTAAGRHALAE